MATINSLMKHLRESGIEISGSNQKRKLRRIGYYHGYKGYRFAKRASNRLPLSNFNQIVALHDFDMRIKSLLYAPLMAIETALKNRVLEAVLGHAGSERFEDIYKKSLTAYKSNNKKKEAWSKRLQLRTKIDQLISKNHSSRDVVSHFILEDKDVPIWAIFEVMTLGDFGLFYGCLHDDVKNPVCKDLGMPTGNFDSPRILSIAIFTLKDLRNAVAHNGIILDVRFKSGNIKQSLGELLKFEMKVQMVTFDEITDYVLLIIYLMACLDFPKTECRQLLQNYEEVIERYRELLPYDIYSQFVGSRTRKKIEAAWNYVRKL